MNLSDLIQCGVCGKSFMYQIPENHLRKHKIKANEYRDRYGPLTSKDRNALAVTKFSAPKVVEYALHLLSPEEVAGAIANAQLSVFSKDVASRTVLASLALQEQRLRAFKACAEISTQIQETFLDEPWRAFVDEQGKPLKAETTLNVWRTASQEMKDIVDAQLRLLQNVVQDNKTVVLRPGANEKKAFTGEVDKLEKYPNVSGAEREKIRCLMEKFFQNHLMSSVEGSEDVKADGEQVPGDE